MGRPGTPRNVQTTPSDRSRRKRRELPAYLELDHARGQLDDLQHTVLREVLEVAYRRQHREVWEIEVSGEDSKHHLPPANKRLETLGQLLKIFGSSTDAAMRPLRDDGTHHKA
jgi:hypothetical protein